MTPRLSTVTPRFHDPHPTPLPAPDRVQAPGRREKLAGMGRRLRGCTARMTLGLEQLATSDSVLR